MHSDQLKDGQGLHPSDDDRRALINIAYRMLGSHAEATDAVGEGLARWYALPEPQRREIKSVRAWLITTVSRICLDVLGSARVQREAYVGAWLPEPTPRASPSNTLPPDPLDQITLDESVSMALLVVLESLTPAERVVFILHDIFSYPFKDVGQIVGRTPEACRQLAGSARRRIDSDAPPRNTNQDNETVEALKLAWETNDLPALIELLDPNVSATTDGGGQVQAAIRPILGAENVAKTLLRVPDRYPGLTFETVPINGEAGLATRDTNNLLALIALSVTDHTIHELWIIRNPKKLRNWL